jgi:hypothetical protein
MAMKFRGALIGVTAAVTVLWAAGPLLACGPFFNVAIYSFSYHPDLPLESFAGGNLGVVQSGWARSYLFTAYRYATGPGFDGDERKALLSLWADRMNAYETPAEPAKPWLDARGKVPGIGQAPYIDVTRVANGQSFSYVNCTNDAFVTAAATLGQMIREFAINGSQVKDWVAAQDQVFGDCASGSAIPAAASAQMTALERAQREYQIASANFYSENFDTARQQFETIAKDTASPWHTISPYLAARTLIRKGTLAAKLDAAALSEAESRLKKIASETNDAGLKSSAIGLIDFIDFRLHLKIGSRQSLKRCSNQLRASRSSVTCGITLWFSTARCRKTPAI